jgi:hypothetical protein
VDTLFDPQTTAPELPPHARPRCPFWGVPGSEQCGLPAGHEGAHQATPATGRDDAIQRVDRHADPELKAKMLEAVHLAATVREELTTDDVWDFLDAAGIDTSGLEPRVLGAVMVRAKGEGWIRPTDRVQTSNRTVNHGRPVRVWLSRIEGGNSDG